MVSFFFWQTMAFKLGGYLSRAATKACLLNRTATIQPTIPFALDVQKFEKTLLRSVGERV